MSAAQDRPVQVNYHLSDSFTPEVDLRVSPPEGFWSDEPHLYAAGVELFHHGRPRCRSLFRPRWPLKTSSIRR
jgi:hypothetical protein